jgi:hypothetical protein
MLDSLGRIAAVKNRCYMLPRSVPVIQLGRFGDLLILFPAFKAIYDRTGVKPTVFVSVDYASLFDGISYATPWPLNVHWYRGVEEARRIALEAFGEQPIIPEWWHDKTTNNIPHGTTVLQCHGIKWGVDMAKWPNFQTSMWDRTGIPVSEMHTLPLVFDRRDPVAEKKLVDLYYPNKRKPLVLVNFKGISSPFKYTGEVMRLLIPFRKQGIEFFDLGQIPNARRLYDLLGLYDAAIGLITTDTATLHLANARRDLPYIAFTVDGWTSSVPRGDCVLEVKYNQTMRRLGEVTAVLERWAAK